MTTPRALVPQPAPPIRWARVLVAIALLGIVSRFMSPLWHDDLLHALGLIRQLIRNVDPAVALLDALHDAAERDLLVPAVVALVAWKRSTRLRAWLRPPVAQPVGCSIAVPAAAPVPASPAPGPIVPPPSVTAETLAPGVAGQAVAPAEQASARPPATRVAVVVEVPRHRNRPRPAQPIEIDEPSQAPRLCLMGAEHAHLADRLDQFTQAPFAAGESFVLCGCGRPYKLSSARYLRFCLATDCCRSLLVPGL